jgi:transcriptional regulator with XRE-family HTH domain
MDKPKSQHLVESLVAAGCTQEEIAQAAGVTQATISRILHGEITDPRHSTMERLQAFALLRPKTTSA